MSHYSVARAAAETMKSERCLLKPGCLYALVGHDEILLECLEAITVDNYSPYCAVLRSVKTGWTMVCHGTNMYSDGTIDWDFSTNGYFSTKGV